MMDSVGIWRELQTLFDLIDRTPQAERQRVLESACPDPVTCAQVLRMVRGANQETACDASPSKSLDTTLRFGPYNVLRVIGSGGIGTVYLAERLLGGAPHRAAIKVLSPHAAGKHFVERFHREQHILALLDHANITRLLDAGLSETGQPYLVMDFVEGVHLDEYCDRESLGVEDRVRLTLQVCEAIAHAHRNLVVHLDLKPSNILVNAEGVVKLLDFGTSKLVQPHDSVTTTILATPAYASPEQLRNEPVTTACDIYSLGAILFYLLTGEAEGGRRSAALAIERAFNGGYPRRLSSVVITEAVARARGTTVSRLQRVLTGDLDTIVAKCLRPQPAERYASVDALMRDLTSYLEGRAILARPQTMLYLGRKFLRRNRISVALTSLLLVALLATGVIASWHQQEALREGRRAVTMQSFVYRLFKFANSNTLGKPTFSVTEFLALSMRLLPDYIKDPADLRQAQLGIAESMYENGALAQARRAFDNVATAARSAHDTAAEAEADAFGGNIDYLNGETESGARLTEHALKLSQTSSVPTSVRVWSEIYYAWNRENSGFRSDKNVQLLQAAVAEARSGHLSERETADALYNWGQDVELRGDLQTASTMFYEVLRVYQDDPAALCEQSDVYGELAWLSEMQGNYVDSLPLTQKSYDGYRQCAGPDSRGALTEQVFLAGALVKVGRAPEPLAIMNEALPKWRKLNGSSPDFAEPLNFMAMAELATGHATEAEAHAREMVAVQTGRVDPHDRRFGASHLLWAKALVQQGRFAEALPHAQIADELLAKNAVSAGAKEMMADAHQVLLDVQARGAATSDTRRRPAY
jgi:serine/threonine protein kinase/tetratricopeptide (TPR) repeat protein